MKKKYYIFTAVISYLLFLAASIPAKPVVDILNANSAVSLRGISGTVWAGQAYTIIIDNNLELKNTEWSFSLWKILTGRIAVDITTQYSDNDIYAEAGISFTGKYFANDVRARIPAEEVAALANIPLAQLSGIMSIDIEHAHWKQGALPMASGVINWNNAAVSVAKTASLGNVVVQLGESEQQLMHAKITNKGGDISITGTAELVPEADYAVNIQLTPTASANKTISQSLAIFASKQGNGSYLFNKTGQLSEIGLM